jgi:hypothetical protein
VVVVKMFDQLPWWSFLIPVFILGCITSILKWQAPAFVAGFIAGFMLWFGMNLYVDIAYHGLILSRWEPLIKITMLLMTGLVGGLLTGLALYAGKKTIAYDKVAVL